jgi:hypothetical protein
VRLVNVAAPIGLMMALGCSNSSPRDAKPLTPRAQRDGEMIDVSGMMATVRGADAPRPQCPVHPHFEASFTVQGIRGPVEYRWERSDSTTGPLNRVVIDSASAGTQQHFPVKPDDWADTRSAIQLHVDETVHVTYPFEFRSAAISIDAMCF